MGKPLRLQEVGHEFLEQVKITKWYKTDFTTYCVNYSELEEEKPAWSIWSADLFNAVKAKRGL